MKLEKRSLRIAGHRTSVALEPAFWAAIENLARRRGVTLPVLCAIIADRYERARTEVRASTIGDQTKLERLAMIDVREERAIARRIKRYTKRLDDLRRRMARSRDERQRDLVRATLRANLHRSLEALPEVHDAL